MQEHVLSGLFGAIATQVTTSYPRILFGVSFLGFCASAIFAGMTSEYSTFFIAALVTQLADPKTRSGLKAAAEILILDFCCARIKAK